MAKKRTTTTRFEKLLDVLKSQPVEDLRPALEGHAYRFTVYLPVLSQGKAVFTGHHVDLLADVFHHRFEGFSANTVEGGPPWQGSWLPPGAEAPIVDRHMLFILYTAMREEAKRFFRHLKSILELKEVANQDVVLVELTAVWLMEGHLLPPES